MDMLAQLFANISLGLGTALTPTNLLFCFFGVFLGTLVGVLPGVGGLTAIAMLIPMTFYLDPATALIMVAGIYYGSSYGGSIASILVNIPGTPAAVVVCLDGYPLALQGRARVVLLMTALSSFVGGSIGILLMMLFSPSIVALGLQFGATEYFALIVLGLITAASVAGNSMLKGIAMVVIGMLFAVIRLDMYTGTPRFTFGIPALYEGIGLVALAMGLFGITEVIASARTAVSRSIDTSEKAGFRAMMPSRDEASRFWKPTMRGSAIGSIVGIIPGVGATVASFMSYSLEKKVAADPSRFGKGAIEGCIAPEAANNAADQTAFIPTLALGIPGSATMALIMGVLLIHGITPGPTLMTSNPDIFWGLVMSFWVGNIMLLILNIPLIGIWVRLLRVPYHYLYPVILVLICLGVYTVNNSVVDIWAAIALGALGYLLRVFGFPPAPLLLGFVLGGLLEEHFRRALILSRGDLLTFVERPISGVILAGVALVLLAGVWGFARRSFARAGVGS